MLATQDAGRLAAPASTAYR